MTRDERIIEALRTYDDEAAMLLIAEANLEAAYRPRDEFDVDVHPDSFRGHILALYDEWERMPRWLRILSRVLAWRPWR